VGLEHGIMIAFMGSGEVRGGGHGMGIDYLSLLAENTRRWHPVYCAFYSTRIRFRQTELRIAIHLAIPLFECAYFFVFPPSQHHNTSVSMSEV
jgi:hypothetical protein